MGRKKSVNLDFPPRMTLSRGTYFYYAQINKKKQWFTLGPNLEYAKQQAAELNSMPTADRTRHLASWSSLPERIDRAFIGETPCCAYCGSTADLEIDHIIPRQMNGSDSLRNLVIACEQCNTTKGGHSPIYLISLLKEVTPALGSLRASLQAE